MANVLFGQIIKGFTGATPLLDAKSEDVANVVFLPEQTDFNPETGILTLKGINALGVAVTLNFQLVGSQDEFYVGWSNVKGAADNDEASSTNEANAVKNAVLVDANKHVLDNLTTGCRILTTSPSAVGWYKPVLICLKSRIGLDEEGNHKIEFFNNLNATDTGSWVMADSNFQVGGKEYAVFIKKLPVRQDTSIKYLVKVFK